MGMRLQHIHLPASLPFTFTTDWERQCRAVSHHTVCPHQDNLHSVSPYQFLSDTISISNRAFVLHHAGCAYLPDALVRSNCNLGVLLTAPRMINGLHAWERGKHFYQGQHTHTHTHQWFTSRNTDVIRGVLCQKQLSRTWTSNYIPQYLWDVITCPCPW